MWPQASLGVWYLTNVYWPHQNLRTIKWSNRDRKKPGDHALKSHFDNKSEVQVSFRSCGSIFSNLPISTSFFDRQVTLKWPWISAIILHVSTFWKQDKFFRIFFTIKTVFNNNFPVSESVDEYHSFVKAKQREVEKLEHKFAEKLDGMQVSADL